MTRLGDCLLLTIGFTKSADSAFWKSLSLPKFPPWLEIMCLLTRHLLPDHRLSGPFFYYFAGAAAAPAAGAAAAPAAGAPAGTGVAEGTPGCGRGYPYASYPPKLNGLYGL